ncbi:MAG: hypothetical protein AB7H90_05315 [Alphaproteobacteria bacterium]
MGSLAEAVHRVRLNLYKAEYFADEDIDHPIPPPGTHEHAKFQDWHAELREKRQPEVMREFHQALSRALDIFHRALPKHDPGPFSFTAPLSDFIPDIGRVIEEMIGALCRTDTRLFEQLKKRIKGNAAKVDNAHPRALAARMEPAELVETYLRGTVLAELFRVLVPLPLTQQKRYEGMWTLARPGAGKTHHVFSTFIHEDLKLVAEGKASVVVLDSQGDQPGEGGKPPPLLYLLPRLKFFAPGEPLHGKLVYIDPDGERPPAFNLFDLGLPGDTDAKFDVTSELMEFVFSSEVGDPFTGNMQRLFFACLRLMLTIPDATIADMRRLLHADGPEIYADVIAALSDPDDRNLFTAELGRGNIGQTHSALLARLEGIKNIRVFERLVSHSKTTFNLFDEIERGSVIIIDTSGLGRGTAVVGRFFIALLGAVSERRVTVPESRKTPCFVFIDELSDYCKKGTSANHLDGILARCRKQNISINMANQRMSQMSSDHRLLDALKQCAIKIANPLSEDAYKIAVDMGETPAKSLTNHPDGTFSIHIAGMGMPRAVPVAIPMGPLRREPFMSKSDYRQIWEEMRERYAPEPEPEPGPEEEPAAAESEPEEDADAPEEPRPHVDSQRPTARRRQRKKERRRSSPPEPPPPTGEDPPGPLNE